MVGAAAVVVGGVVVGVVVVVDGVVFGVLLHEMAVTSANTATTANSNLGMGVINSFRIFILLFSGAGRFRPAKMLLNISLFTTMAKP